MRVEGSEDLDAEDALRRKTDVRGRVLEGLATPAVGFRVQVRVADEEGLALRTEADGRFETVVESPSNARAALVVTAGHPTQALAASASRYLDPGSPSVVDVGDLMLLPAARLDVHVFHEGEAVPDADVFVSVASAQGDLDRERSDPLPWKGWPWRGRTDTSGTATFPGLVLGDLRIVALRGERTATLRRRFTGPASVDLELQPARTLDVVVVDAGGRGIEGVAPFLFWGNHPLDPPRAPPMTDADGRSMIHGLPQGQGLSVVAIHPEWTWPINPGGTSAVPADAETFRIVVPMPRTLAWRIEVMDGEMPQEGAKASIRRREPGWWEGRPWGTVGAVGTVRDGLLHVPALRISATSGVATLEDGRVASLRLLLPMVGSEGDPVVAEDPAVFQSPRSLSVRVETESGGGPAPDVAVRVRPRRNSAFYVARTDDQGLVVFRGLPAAVVDVWVSSNPDLVEPRRLGAHGRRSSVDLRTATEGEILLSVPRRVEARVQVSTDGIPVFPPGFQVEARILPEAVAWVPLRGYRLDRATSEIVFDVREPSSGTTRTGRVPTIEVRVSGRGYAPKECVLVQAEGDRMLRAGVDLRPPAAIRVRILALPDREVPRLQRQRPDGTWRTSRYAPALGLPEDEGSFVFRLLGPGTYRLHLWVQNVTSAALEVVPAPDPIDVVWDLSDMGWVDGMVDLPEGVPEDGLTVTVDGEPPSNPWIPARVTGRHFQVRVPGGHPVTIRAHHPLCVPHLSEGAIIVTKPGSGFRLRLVLPRGGAAR